MSTTRLSSPRSLRSVWSKRLDQLLALVVLVNVSVVVFDLSYIRLRDFYLRYLPQVTQYDFIKGIEPYRDTVQYLDSVDRLTQAGIENPAAPRLLQDLRDRSVSMIEEDPFRIANKSGSLEKLKNRMRRHMGQESAKEAFRQFWSLQHLNPQNWPTELAYFNKNYRPILAANYYRPIDESGDFVDRFWLIDIWFMGLFALDLAIRVLWIRRRYRKTWQEALLWRWYDLFLLMPFWRILRIVPLLIRLHEAGLIHLHAIQKQVNRNIAENIAAEVTELILLQGFRTVQASIQQGALRQLLKQAPAKVEVNDIDEVATILNRLSEVVTQTVLPNIQPELEQVIHHLVLQTLAQTPFYRLQGILPGFERLAADLSQQIAHQSLQTIKTVLSSSMNDIEGQRLMQLLGQSTLSHFQSGLNQKRTLGEIETLIVTWLEELKLSTIQRLEYQDQTPTLKEMESIRQQRKSPEVLSPSSGSNRV